ncbi:MAG: hypothetical protein ACI9MB_003466 [Verrucomicrobiales bacterium]|jgi:hypothetical protein
MPPAKSRKKAARKSPPKKRGKARTGKKLSAQVEAAPGHFLIPLTWFKTVFGLLLLPICYLTTTTFLSVFVNETSTPALLLRSAPLWFFSTGVVLWVLAFAGLPRPIYIYVLGHELTHALFVYLCLGKVTSFKVDRTGGHIVTNRNNVLISLSPYFFPLYSCLMIIGFGIAGLFIDLAAVHPGALFFGHVSFSWSWILFLLIGFTWAFHFTFTAWMIAKDQPDLKQNGTFFSLTVIYLINLLILSAFIILASKATSRHDFLRTWLENANQLRAQLL